MNVLGTKFRTKAFIPSYEKLEGISLNDNAEDKIRATVLPDMKNLQGVLH